MTTTRTRAKATSTGTKTTAATAPTEPASLYDPALDLQLVHEHPKNPRRAAVASDELVESVRTQGLVQALVVAPHPTQAGYYVLIAGHRRLDALLRAGYVTAKAEIRFDLTTEAQQIEAMLVENSARQDLTAIEEAEAYEQLQLFNLKPGDIAKRVGRSPKTVRDRLKLLSLSEAGRGRVHDGQVTIDDALQVADLDTDARTRMEPYLGTGDFRHKLAAERDRRKRMDAYAADLAIAANSGVLAYSAEPVDTWALQREHVAQRLYASQYADGVVHLLRLHPECLRWANHPDHAGVPVLVYLCADPDSHVPGADDRGAGDAAPEKSAKDLEREAEFARQRAEREAREEAERAAAAVRLDTLTTADPAQVLRVGLPLLLWSAENIEISDFTAVLGLDHAEQQWDCESPWWPKVSAALAKADDARVLAAVVALIAGELNLRVADALGGSDGANPLVAAVFDLLLELGHPFSDVDAEQHATALGAAADDRADDQADDQEASA